MKEQNFGQIFKWHKRHIVIDHANARILIQVMWTTSGQLDEAEFQQIMKGNFQQFLPNGFTKTDIGVRNEIKKLLGSNYKVEPFFWQGIENEEHAIIQLTPLLEKNPKLIKLEPA